MPDMNLTHKQFSVTVAEMASKLGYFLPWRVYRAYLPNEMPILYLQNF